MSILGSGKKAAKFVFVSMPLSLFGINQLKMGNQQIADLWRSLTNPTCPVCDAGVLLRSEGDANTVDHETGHQLYPWACSHCGWGFLQVKSKKKVSEDCARYRGELIKAKLTNLEIVEREKYARAHRLHSRAFFITATLAVLGFLYMIASGAALILAFNWLCFALVAWIFGLKRSYRCWQLTTGTLFVKNSFWQWLKNEKWII